MYIKPAGLKRAERADHDDFEVAKEVVFVRPKKGVISLRLGPQVIHKLKEVADREGLSPTTYARMLIIRGLRTQPS